jgi:hypothetical protein
MVINPNDPAQIQFIRRHRQTRSVIEQAFGILKEKFPCFKAYFLEVISHWRTFYKI